MRLSDVTSVALLGAAGKMGREIARLLVELMQARVTCIDTSGDGLERLQRELMNKVQYSTSPDAVAGADLVFEAIDEDLSVKGRLLRAAGLLSPNAYFFTNTSAIPISEIAREAGLDGRLIGFHFFNPPSRQQLVELICPEGMRPELTHLALAIAKRLGKKVVFSADVAGFISNGHFLREVRYACGEVAELSQLHGMAQAIVLVNEVTRELLVRPMGIFEVVDYVGVDVCRQIGQVMSRFLSGSDFEIPLLDQVAKGGSFFQYEKGSPVRVYDVNQESYIPLPKRMEERRLTAPAWKELRDSKRCRESLHLYFRELFADRSAEAEIARDYLFESREIGQQLVRNGVARELEDVNRVLQLGFAHLYGPKNNYY